ncbi:hypothetical protein HPB49_005225 [Dermacentor silvarum]|uniref:Uncharacterized protein n=1 Tax=Dermacentor silvarum TaxID=543639 RepID=A0ACB8CPQ8_DERSI|nr:hypothetical protein HPB49_005225 [Dermacentor silvarum]
MKEHLQKLEAIFSQNLAYVSWVDNVRAVLARYQLRRYPTLQFGFSGNNCAPFSVQTDAEPINFYQKIAQLQQAKDVESVSMTAMFTGSSRSCNVYDMKDVWNCA